MTSASGKVLAFCCLLALATAMACAWSTADNFHPDEYAHIDGYRYFEGKIWPPDLNSDGLEYSPYGWSRVYTGEIIYPILGNLGHLLKKTVLPDGVNDYKLYRTMNLFLLAVVLALLLASELRPFDKKTLVLLALGFPQFIYLFSYANSDGFGLFLSFALFLRSWSLYKKDFQAATMADALALGLLAGLILSSKPNYYAALIIPFALVAMKTGDIFRRLLREPKKVLAMFAAALALMVAVAAPLKLIYPATQGDWAARERAMRLERALDEFKPDTKLYDGLDIASKGMGYLDLIVKYNYVNKTLGSLWGVYGYMTVHHSPPLYWVVSLCLAALFMANWANYFSRFKSWPAPVAVLVPAGLAAVVALFCGMAWVSLHVDMQPQGRYLYGAFIPMLLTLGGTAQSCDGWRETCLAQIPPALYVLSMWSLWSKLILV